MKYVAKITKNSGEQPTWDISFLDYPNITATCSDLGKVIETAGVALNASLAEMVKAGNPLLPPTPIPVADSDDDYYGIEVTNTDVQRMLFRINFGEMQLHGPSIEDRVIVIDGVESQFQCHHVNKYTDGKISLGFYMLVGLNSVLCSVAFMMHHHDDVASAHLSSLTGQTIKGIDVDPNFFDVWVTEKNASELYKRFVTKILEDLYGKPVTFK